MEGLREAWIDAPDPGAQKAIAVQLQAVTMRDVPYLPTGPCFHRTAYRRDIQDIVDGRFVFWNAHHA